jgi:predicted O-methyltransferase YrrM
MPVLPDILGNIFATGITYTGSGEAVPVRAAVSFKEANLLYELVRKTQPTRSLEIGMGQGISTLAILGAIKDNGFGHHHVVDPYETAYDNAGLAAVERAALTPYMTFHPTPSEYVIPHLSAIDLAFIDASHLFDLTLADFVLIDKKLCVGGLIGFHDLWLPAYRQVLDYVLSNRAYTPYNWALRQLPRWRQWLSRFVSSQSVLRRIFNRRLFTLPPSRGAPNLALIQKMQEDSRNWDFHVRF